MFSEVRLAYFTVNQSISSVIKYEVNTKELPHLDLLLCEILLLLLFDLDTWLATSCQNPLDSRDHLLLTQVLQPLLFFQFKLSCLILFCLEFLVDFLVYLLDPGDDSRDILIVDLLADIK